MFSPEAIRADFPLLREEVHNQRLIYLDNAATAQLPRSVTDVIAHHYAHDNANVHRGIHELSNRSTRALERARQAVAEFIGAPSPDCVVFTSGTTASINMVASSLGQSGALERSSVIVTHMEHHANFVPWQQAALRANARFEVAGLTEDTDLDFSQLEHILETQRTSVLALTHVSNVTGTVNDVARAAKLAHDHGALVVVDAAQSAPHLPLNVAELGCDALAFSGHKMHALTGIGVLYLSPHLREYLEPTVFGGEMVDKVSCTKTTFEKAPLRFEAGTPNYVGALSLGAAIDYLNGIDRTAAHLHEQSLTTHAEQRLRAIKGLKILGTPSQRGPVLSFTVEEAHPLDLAMLLNLKGVAVRSGSSCAQPLLNDVFGIKAMTRMSFALYNTHEEVDLAVDALEQAVALLRRRAGR